MLKTTRKAGRPACSITATNAVTWLVTSVFISIFETGSEPSHVFPPRLRCCDRAGQVCWGRATGLPQTRSMRGSCYRKGTARFHAERLLVRSIGCYNASGGFFGTTEGGSAIPSSEIDCDLCCVILKLCSSGRRRIGNVPRADRSQMCSCASLFPSLPELIEGQLDDRRSIKSEHLRDNQPADDSDAERLPQFAANAHADGKRQCAEERGHRCHHDTTKANNAPLVNLFSRPEPFPSPCPQPHIHH